jgi:glycine dehydrogenase subunit 1
MAQKQVVHPYIPNSEPHVKKQMLDFLGMDSSEDIYKEIPDALRFKGTLNIPEPIQSEYKLQRHVEGLLKKNKNAKDNLCFLGGGTWQHHIPAVCDTIIGRDEFLTAYVGDAFSDHGKFQALFESSSMLGELTGFEACNTPTYDWANAIAIACRMAARTSGKSEILLASNMSPSHKSVVKNYCKPEIAIQEIGYDCATGLLDIADLQAKLSSKTAAVYFENPSYLGSIEEGAADICKLAKAAGALIIVGVDPTSLGILEAPGNYGADYAVGDLQPLGLHMSYGGGLGGFICTHDKKEFVGEYPSLLFGICDTVKEGEYGFGEVFYERTSYASREKGKDFIGTCAALHGIVAGVYMALMGPQGFVEMGEGILQRVAYAKAGLSQIPGVKIVFSSTSYCDFLVNFDDTGKTVTDINKALLQQDIFGGRDVSMDFPVGQSALFSITEVHEKEDIDRLTDVLARICR